ncbi:hypothetical protein [Flavobacterium filum]|uniref:hypothetical protein n=1 Tax=Flavobacterium filum TaxID=370974 RepID=UPI0023F55A8F|nr:hypothetical protein [Flavobacterium filum]
MSCATVTAVGGLFYISIRKRSSSNILENPLSAVTNGSLYVRQVDAIIASGNLMLYFLFSIFFLAESFGLLFCYSNQFENNH